MYRNEITGWPISKRQSPFSYQGEIINRVHHTPVTGTNTAVRQGHTTLHETSLEQPCPTDTSECIFASKGPYSTLSPAVMKLLCRGVLQTLSM
jgi:hypothetical protein